MKIIRTLVLVWTALIMAPSQALFAGSDRADEARWVCRATGNGRSFFVGMGDSEEQAAFNALTHCREVFATCYITFSHQNF